MNPLLKYFLAWFPMLLLAIANGALREFIFKKYTGELTAHQLSTFSLLLLFAIYIRMPPVSANQAILVGLFWLVLTLLFEFGFGRFRGNSWETMFADYNLLKGRLWILIPVWIAIAPYVFFKLMNR
jgi:hypothetical protein